MNAHRLRPLSIAVAVTALVGFFPAPRPSHGQEDKIQLKDAPQRPLVIGNCAICHSLDYIPMNSPFLDRKGWENEVTKMIKVMGAPVAPANVAPIVEYLSHYYGKPDQNKK